MCQIVYRPYTNHRQSLFRSSDTVLLGDGSALMAVAHPNRVMDGIAMICIHAGVASSISEWRTRLLINPETLYGGVGAVQPERLQDLQTPPQLISLMASSDARTRSASNVMRMSLCFRFRFHSVHASFHYRSCVQ